MKRYITITGILLSQLSILFAQGPMDAMLFSRYYSGGTARYTAMSGAFGALGGDFSTLSANPAGIGVYRSSEFVFTTGVFFNYNETQTLGLLSKDNQAAMNVGNIGYVGNWMSTKSDGLVSLSWGLGMNRLHDFNRNSVYRTRGNTNSLTDVMAAETVDDGITPGDFENNSIWGQSGKWRNVLGWDTYLIDSNNNPDYPYNSILLPETMTNQDKYVQERGSINEWTFSFGGNISHKLYFGTTIGVQSLYYSRQTNFYETFVSDWSDGSTYKQYDRILDEDVYYTGGNFKHYDYLRTSGTGINFKAGVIYRPIDALRLGLAIHTPTLYGLHDYYYQNINTNDIYYPKGLDDNGQPIDLYNKYAETPDGNYEYNLHTPMKFMASAAYVLGKVGLISFDYELTNYSNMRLDGLSGSYSDFSAANDQTKKIYRTSHGFRGGAEAAINNYFKLRGGAAYYTSPNTTKANEADIDQFNEMLSFSGGIGFRADGFFLDLAYMFRQQKSDQYFYHYSGPNENITDIISQNKGNDHLINLTLGFKF